MRTPSSSRRLERIALGLGLAASAGLLVAAFVALGAPSEVGWSRLNELVARARENVVASWAATTAVDGDDVPGAASPLVAWTSAEAARAATAPTRAVAPVDASATPSDFFRALFAESERAEIEGGDAREALALVEEASSKPANADELADARLRAVQLCVRLGDPARARAHAERALRDVPEWATTGGAPTAVAILLAALPALEPDERATFAEPVVETWTRDAWAFDGVEPRFERASGPNGATWHRTESPLETALRERLLEVCGRPATLVARFAALDADRARRALWTLTGDLPTDPGLSAVSWRISPAGPDLVAVRREASDRFVARIVDRDAFEHAFETRLAESRALPEGFALDVSGARADLGESVGAPIDLGLAWPRATLRHPDLESVRRAAIARNEWSRAGLVVLALAVAGAACATVVALRRERRLTEARTAFVAAVSHELRTPVASILLMAENLESGRAGANAPRYHALIRREASRLRRLVDDVLDFSRLERGRRFEARVEDVETARWLEALSEEARDACAAAGVEFRADLASWPAHASFDPEAVRRAVANLVVNALRHSGSPVVELRARVDAHGRLTLAVVDRGRGVPERERETIFAPFARLAGSQTTPGAGLGLAIVREIAAAHGGDATVRAGDDGVGATFEITLRASDAHGAASESRGARA